MKLASIVSEAARLWNAGINATKGRLFACVEELTVLWKRKKLPNSFMTTQQKLGIHCRSLPIAKCSPESLGFQTITLDHNHTALDAYRAPPRAGGLCWQPASSAPSALNPCGWKGAIWRGSWARSLHCSQQDLLPPAAAGDDVDGGAGKAGEGEKGHWEHGRSAGGRVHSSLHPLEHHHSPCLCGTWTRSGRRDASACKGGTFDAKPSGSGAPGTGWSPHSSFPVDCHWPVWRLIGGAGEHAAPISLRHVLSALFQKTGLLWQPGTG